MDKENDNDTMAAFALHFVANGVVQIHCTFLQFEQELQPQNVGP